MRKQQPGKERMVQCTIHLPVSILEKIKERAEKERRTFSLKSALLIEEALKQEEEREPLAS